MVFVDNEHMLVEDEDGTNIIEDIEHTGDEYDFGDLTLEEIEEEENRRNTSNRVNTRNRDNDGDDPLAYYNEDYFE